MSVTETVSRIDNDAMIAVVKADVLGSGDVVPATQAKQPEVVTNLESLEWPYDPRLLCQLFELSSNLRPNVDSYATNIDAFGHTFHPKINVKSERVRETVADAIFLRRSHQHERIPNAPIPTMPTDEEIDQEIERLELKMRLELATLKSFFSSCCVGEDFVRLRRKTRQDLEVLGNGFWEAIRNLEGKLVLLNYIPAFTMKLGRQTPEIGVMVRIESSALDSELVQVKMRFRKYIQDVDVAHGGRKKTWFKAFGDPRVMSSRTGNFYESLESMRTVEGEEVRQATEVLHFGINSPRTPYGVPRWIGALLSVVGTRQAEEVNYLYFENKSVPPLVVMVSNGRLAPNADQRIKTYIQNEIKGKKNFHKILVLEAEPAGKHQDGAGRVKIEVKPLTQAIQSDAHFQKYDERNADKVGQQFRLPRMLRGDIRDFNKSTAFAALMFTEMQVFEPERKDFDTDMNRRVLPDLDVRFWEFRSLAPVTRDPKTLSDMVRDLVRASVLTPEEGRLIAGDIFNHEFALIDEDWVKQPMQMTLAEINVAAKGMVDADTEDADPKDPKTRLLPIAKLFVDLHSLLEEAGAEQLFADAKDQIQPSLRQKAQKMLQHEPTEYGDGLESETVQVPKSEFETWIQPST